jgi:hypothetical protein
MKRQEVVTGLFLATLVLAGVSGLAGRIFAAIGVDPDAVQVTDALVGLATLAVVGLAWLGQRRQERLAAERIALVAISGDERVQLPLRPLRSELNRAELFGLVGAILGAPRFDCGPALLAATQSENWVAVKRGSSSILELDLGSHRPDFEALRAKSQS